MARTFIRPETQIRSSKVYDDTIAPALAAFETSPTNLEADLNNLRSIASELRDARAGNWYDALTAPSALEAGAIRGVQNTNDALHLIEKKRVIRAVDSIVDLTVTAAQNWEVLAVGELPPNLIAAVGAVTTLGTVVAAHGGVFGTTHSVAEVAGSTALNPKNLVEIVDGATRDPILDAGGERIWGLLQTEVATDGHTINITTQEAQISFVVINAGGNDLVAAAVASIAGKTINVRWPERVRFEDLTEQDFLRGAIADVPSGATVTRQVGYDTQGTTPVDLVTNATLDLEGPGLAWAIRDDLQADLLKITEGSAGGTSVVQVSPATDTFDVDAVLNDFLNGAKFDTGAAGTTINVGVTPNQIDAGGALVVRSGGGADLNLEGALEVNLTDSYRPGSTWSLPAGVTLADSAAEWSAFEVQFGEVSLLAAITAASNTGGFAKTCADVTVDTNADVDVGGVAGGTNLNAQIHSLAGGTFISDHDVFINGTLLRNGANAAANNDVYPGTSLANGQLKFEFDVDQDDVICVISRA